MLKEELEKENVALKGINKGLEDTNGVLHAQLKQLSEENGELKKDIEAFEKLKGTHDSNKQRMDKLIAESLDKIEKQDVMNSVVRDDLECLCKARNLLGGDY